jgi:hypothetical protein
MNKRIGLVSLGLAGVLVVGGGVAVAATTGPPGSGGAITGCYTNAEVNGSHAVVLQDAGTSCPKGTTAVSWSEQGPAGPQGLQGQPGQAGQAGQPGSAGADGSSIVTSPDVPTAACNPGDIDVDLANGEVYTCVVSTGAGAGKVSTGSGTGAAVWSDTGSSIMGPQGPAGTPGANGTNIVTSADVPTDACNLGDNDVDLTNGEVYTCVAGTGYDTGVNNTGGGSGATSSTSWIDTGSSIMGPQGPQGLPGPGYAFTSTSGAAGPPLTDGTYFVDVEASIGNTGPADAVIGDCAVSSRSLAQRESVADIAGTFAVPAVAADEDLTAVPFSFSGIMTIGQSGSAGITPELACADTTGATVTPDSVTWWVSPVATSS